MKYYDEKTRKLTLVKEVKGEELITETYSYPLFSNGFYTSKAIDLGEELEENEYTINSTRFEDITRTIVGVYGDQFTSEELIYGIDNRENIAVYMQVLYGILGNDSKNA